MVKDFDFENPCFNERAEEFLLKNTEEGAVNSDDLLRDLIDTLNSTDRVYICANEIGYGVRAFCVKVGEEIREFFNPIFQKKEDLKLIREIDPTDKKEYLILRPTKVTLCFLDKNGKERAIKFDENSSPVIAQAMDCLEGLHDADYGLEILPEFDQATDEERTELVEEYIKNITTFSKELDDTLRKDDDLKPYWMSYKFNMAKTLGEVEVVDEDAPKNRKQRRLFNKFVKKFGRKHKND